MSEPAPVPAEQPWIDLRGALQRGLAAVEGLLTAGEQDVLRRLWAAPAAARSLYARLWSRRPAPFVVAALDYEEVGDPAAAAERLVALGLADDAHRWWPLSRLVPHATVPELKAALRSAGAPVGGRKAALVERILAAGGGEFVRADARVALRHRGLVGRLVALGMGGRRADLSKLVVERLGHVRYAAYAPTTGPGLFATRRSLISWEQARHRAQALDEAGAVEALPSVLAAVEAAPPLDPLRYRWSARRFDEALALRGAATLEAQGDKQTAADVYMRLLAAGLRDGAHATQRLALCLEALDRPAEGAARCAAWIDGPPAADPLDPGARAVARTGRRLARKARAGWRPLPPLTRPVSRSVRLPPASGGRRPRFESPRGAAPVEPALVAWLAASGRRAMHVEGALWTTLFALLLRPAIFAPIPGMLPAPLLRGPLDLRTPGFYRRRRGLIDERLDALRDGAAPELLDLSLRDHAEESIAGARWDRVQPPALRQVVADLPGGALAAVLQVLALDWRGARRGLPDLVVLPGPSLRLPWATPRRLAESVVLVEIKTPNDQLSDAQRVWLHRLSEAGVRTELWRVEPAG